MRGAPALEWQKLPTNELVEELCNIGMDLPPGLVDEILRRGEEAIPALGRLVADEDLWDRDEWAPLFALHLLGAIGHPSAAKCVVAALRVNPEPNEIVENTPTLIGHLGPEAIPEFARFILDEQADGLMRGVACDGIASIALLHPATRPAITGFLRRFVEEAEKRDKVAVTGAILSLVELRDRESLPAIAAAFRKRRVDEDFLYLEDARDAMRAPETISSDWHYTGDPREFFSPESLEALRRKAQHG
ncbi:MAG: hypothetical protein HY321_07070 [Armatimonadetes bacterium]|nr:hypothetical protein [Armatimonadota bacterium]